jgi:hypothetical protein
MTYNRTMQINPNRQKVSYRLIPQQAPSSSHPQQKGGRERSREKKKMAEKKEVSQIGGTGNYRHVSDTMSQ